ncbi:MAG: CCA tRNA nucleotidyltransferase [Acutalibacteraceae bacterium]|jgi:tRNA nucleotidyltransferase (CCA-adding enzyme)
MAVCVPDFAREVLCRLREGGFEAWAVGGCVRDSLLGRVPQDWDVTTSALPEEIKRCFAEYRVIETGIAHGTVTVICGGEPVEVTTYRVDGTYFDSRHPDFVTFTRSLHEDLARRDFTVNAMAFCEQEGLRDDFDGQEDLVRRVIRCVGSPERRFHEDALRILRALRFASTLEFSLEANTAAAVLSCAGKLRTIAAERIFAEWSKLLCGKGAEAVLCAFPQVFEVFLEELRPLLENLTAWRQAAACACRAPQEKCLRIALLFRAMPGLGAAEQAALAKSALRRLRAENKMIFQVCALIGTELPYPVALPEVRRLLGRNGEELFSAQLALLRAEGREDITAAEQMKQEILVRGDCISLSQLALKGSDLPGAGKKTGMLLNIALDAVMDDCVSNRRADLLRYLKQRQTDQTEQ